MVTDEPRILSYQRALLGPIGADVRQSGSDREAAVKAMMEAVGGSVDSMHFVRGRYDVVVEISVPNHGALLGVTTALKASGAFDAADYLEYLDFDPIIEQANRVAKAYMPAG